MSEQASDQVTNQKPKSKRGFAALNPQRLREIASKGGKAVHAKGTAHEFTKEEARIAGSKGGIAAHVKGTAHQFTTEEARAAGRLGSLKSKAKAATQTQAKKEEEE